MSVIPQESKHRHSKLSRDYYGNRRFDVVNDKLTEY
jgi:hypothetical protein